MCDGPVVVPGIPAVVVSADTTPSAAEDDVCTRQAPAIVFWRSFMSSRRHLSPSVLTLISFTGLRAHGVLLRT